MKTKWVALLLLLFLPLAGAAGTEDMQVTSFAKNNFYVYLMGGMFVDVESNLYPATNSFQSPIFGAGYTFVNIKDRFLINLEFDFVPGRYDMEDLRNQQIDFYTFMSTIVYRFNRSKISVFSGLGLAGLQHSGLEADFVFTLAASVGMKIKIKDNLNLRMELRSYWEDAAFYEYEYLLDEYYDPFYDRNCYATVLALGLEYYF